MECTLLSRVLPTMLSPGETTSSTGDCLVVLVSAATEVDTEVLEAMEADTEVLEATEVDTEADMEATGPDTVLEGTALTATAWAATEVLVLARASTTNYQY